MLHLRRSADRGHFKYGWLETFHSFSFGDYVDPRHRGFSVLRVLNEDWIVPGEGFPAHAHRDMEIFTYVLQGALEHRDSMGHTGLIRAGDVQRMSAGTGVEHSEYNASSVEAVHLLQIWFYPEAKGTLPSYEQKTLAAASDRSLSRLIFSPDGRDGSLSIGQNILGYDFFLKEARQMVFTLASQRRGWIQLTQGRVRLFNEVLEAGDGAAIDGFSEIAISCLESAQGLFFDLP